jgi:hypothetical protein
MSNTVSHLTSRTCCMTTVSRAPAAAVDPRPVLLLPLCLVLRGPSANPATCIFLLLLLLLMLLLPAQLLLPMLLPIARSLPCGRHHNTPSNSHPTWPNAAASGSRHTPRRSCCTSGSTSMRACTGSHQPPAWCSATCVTLGKWLDVDRRVDFAALPARKLLQQEKEPQQARMHGRSRKHGLRKGWCLGYQWQQVQAGVNVA